ncbi:hypothetical protein VTI74DRAFT_699 [Chaetomium olivicolor]
MASQGSSEDLYSSAQTPSSRSAKAAARRKDSSIEIWDDTETCECEHAYWEQGYDNEEEVYHDEEEDWELHEQGQWGLSLASNYTWISNEERMRVAFRRARANAEKTGLDRSPFFPKTAAEYVGTKAAMLEDKAALLRAKVAGKEAMLGAKGGNARWEVIPVVGPDGLVGEKTIPVYFSAAEGANAPAQDAEGAGDEEEAGMGEGEEGRV